jgi:TIR domain
MAKIFLSYRRTDSIATAGRLRDTLGQAFGESNVFLDIDSIPIGADFVTHVESQVVNCNVLLALIGNTWIDTRNAQGKLRLGNEDDYVTAEISAALTHNIPVVPILIDGAAMPSEDQLPASLKLLSRRNAFQLRNDQFRSDAIRLIGKVHKVVGKIASFSGLPRAPLALGIIVLFFAVLAIVGWEFRPREPLPATAPQSPSSISPSGANSTVGATIIQLPKVANYCGPIKTVIASTVTRFESIVGRSFGDNRIPRVPLDGWEDCIVFMETRFSDVRSYVCRLSGFSDLTAAESAVDELARSLKDECLGSTWSMARSYSPDRQKGVRLVDEKSDATVTLRPSKDLTTPSWHVEIRIE